MDLGQARRNGDWRYTGGMKRALIIRHHPKETLAANFRGILDAREFEPVPVDLFDRLHDDWQPPSLDRPAVVMAFGGPMSANDDLPAFHWERQFLREAMDGDLPVFGVCLGAQMMSAALGGTVEPTGGYQFGLRKIHVTAEGDADPVFSKIRTPLVPTLHGECFTIPRGAIKLAEGDILCRDGLYRRINMAFRYRNSYGFQFEPQLTLDEFLVWNEVFYGDYALMGDRFDPREEAARNEREFTKFARAHEAQMGELLAAFLENAGL